MKDVDFERRLLVVCDGKGGKDRVVMLPRSIEATLLQNGTDIRTVLELLAHSDFSYLTYSSS